MLSVVAHNVPGSSLLTRYMLERDHVHEVMQELDSLLADSKFIAAAPFQVIYVNVLYSDRASSEHEITWKRIPSQRLVETNVEVNSRSFERFDAATARRVFVSHEEIKRQIKCAVVLALAVLATQYSLPSKELVALREQLQAASGA